MMGKFAERFDVSYLETLLDVFSQDSFYQTLHIRPFVAKPLHLREAAVVNVIHEGTLALGIGFGGDALRVNLMILAILREREGVKMDFILTPSQMGGQFSAEQLGIAACDKNMTAGPQQAIHK